MVIYNNFCSHNLDPVILQISHDHKFSLFCLIIMFQNKLYLVANKQHVNAFMFFNCIYALNIVVVFICPAALNSHRAH